MGKLLFDQYSLLHFSVGSVAYFWGVNFIPLLIAHTVFEGVENTQVGIKFINNLPLWPGGKRVEDSGINIIGDTISVVAGWTVAWQLDEMGKRRNWYK